MKFSGLVRHRYNRTRQLAVVMLIARGFTGILAYGQTGDLIVAAKRGDLPAVDTLLKSGADVNDRKNTAFGSTTALMEASEQGHLEVVQALLAAKAAVNATRAERKDGETALALAVPKGHVEVVKTLLAAGADVDRMVGSATVLYLATTDGNVDMVKALLAAKPDLDRPSKISGATALMMSISSGSPRHAEITPLLVKAGANVNMWTKEGITALMLASGQGSPRSLALVQILLAAGAIVDTRNCWVPVPADNPAALSSYARARSHTALGLASTTGNAEVVRALLAAKADVNLKQCDGKTPLELALENGHEEVAAVLRSAIAASTPK